MTAAAKNKTPLIVPDKIPRRAGFKPGEEVEFHPSGRVTTITPKMESATGEYTPEQRKTIDREIRKGPAFASVKEMAAIESAIRKRKRKSGK